jgi:hypothetical protein
MTGPSRSVVRSTRFMADIVFAVVTIAFFAVTLAFVKAVERL